VPLLFSLVLFFFHCKKIFCLLTLCLRFLGGAIGGSLVEVELDEDGSFNVTENWSFKLSRLDDSRE
jgi:hypothetical protein